MFDDFDVHAMSYHDIPPPDPQAPPSGRPAADLAEVYALATDAEVDWLCARVLDDYGVPRHPDYVEALRYQAGFAARHRASGMPARWLRELLMDIHGGKDHPPEVAAHLARVAERVEQMAAPGWRP